MSRVDRNHGEKNKKKQKIVEEEILGNNNDKLRKNKKRKRLRKFFEFILVLAIIIVGGFLYAAFSSGLVQDPTGIIKLQDQFKDGKANILIVGSDIRPKDNASRSDTLIVGSFDFKAGIANLLSIPRDTRVLIPGQGKDKINHAYAYGGIDLTKMTVENFLGIEIDKTVEINFDSFKKTVDQIGGVDIDIEQDMYYPEEEIDLTTGEKTLNGDDALAYVRFRGTPTGDLGRIERQQKFLVALGSGVKNKANIFQQASILTDILGKIKTNINFQEASYMLSKYRELDSFIISTWTSQGFPETIDGIFYLIPEDKTGDNSRAFLEGKLFVIKDPNNSEKRILVTSEEKAQIETEVFSDSIKNNSINNNNSNNYGNY